MKKLLLSGFIVGLFVLYGLAVREQASTLTPVTPSTQQSPQIIIVTPTPSSSGSPPQKTQPSPPQNSSVSSGQYKDGTYAGSVADAFYGYVQVQVTISGGRITNVAFLQYPNDRSTSIMINTQAMPYLQQEALQAQSANVDIVSGASDTSQAFQQSLASALSQAH